MSVAGCQRHCWNAPANAHPGSSRLLSPAWHTPSTRKRPRVEGHSARGGAAARSKAPLHRCFQGTRRCLWASGNSDRAAHATPLRSQDKHHQTLMQRSHTVPVRHTGRGSPTAPPATRHHCDPTGQRSARCEPGLDPLGSTASRGTSHARQRVERGRRSANKMPSTALESLSRPRTPPPKKRRGQYTRLRCCRTARDIAMPRPAASAARRRAPPENLEVQSSLPATTEPTESPQDVERATCTPVNTGTR
mmetsp:Transcript_5330/g.15198  ORF Transcript_5330/g.15198 Transcript_5330/m.15198 type:complete len:249 (+) Transcript_5330:225-971(+)